MIRIESVSKSFRIYARPRDRLLEALTGRPRHVERRVLRDVSLTAERGQVFGVLGRNGAGKSTLLKLVMGVLLPDSGRVVVEGRATGLLELGTGFDPALSGRRNIAFNAALLGMAAEEAEARAAAIIAFSELGAMIDAPLAAYSSGMTMRLAFSVAIHADPDALIVDEALAVGDAHFQQKCMRRIHEFRERGGTILLVTHDMTAVRALCDRAVLIEDGRIARDGDPREVADHYLGIVLKDLHETTDGAAALAVSERGEAVGTGDVALEACWIEDLDGAPIESVTTGRSCRVVARLRTVRAVESPHYGLAVRDRYGRSLYETNTFQMGGPAPPPLDAGATVDAVFEFGCALAEGDYAISIGVAARGYGDGLFEEYLLLRHEAAILRVARDPAGPRIAGVIDLRMRAAVRPAVARIASKEFAP